MFFCDSVPVSNFPLFFSSHFSPLLFNVQHWARCLISSSSCDGEWALTPRRVLLFTLVNLYLSTQTQTAARAAWQTPALSPSVCVFHYDPGAVLRQSALQPNKGAFQPIRADFHHDGTHLGAGVISQCQPILWAAQLSLQLQVDFTDKHYRWGAAVCKPGLYAYFVF